MTSPGRHLNADRQVVGTIRANRTPNYLLTQQRKAAGWTAAELATRMHLVAIAVGLPEPAVDGNMVSRWECGVNRPRHGNALLLCLVFAKPPQQLGLGATSQLLNDYARYSPSVGPISGPEQQDPVLVSMERARHVATSLRPVGRTLPYRPDHTFNQEFHGFLRSSRRVLLVEGAMGVGKTTLCCEVVHALAPEGAVQLHLVQHLDLGTLDLSIHILRYADVANSVTDPLLQLSRLIEDAKVSWLVAFDGVNDMAQWRSLVREIDRLLAHIPTPRLRFLVTHRPLPGLRLSEYPMVSALLHQSGHGDPGQPVSSYRMELWSEADAERFWSDLSDSRLPEYADLPPLLQAMMRRPLYMTLVRQAYMLPGQGLSCIPSPFELVDTCVRAALHQAGADVDSALRTLQRLASQSFDENFFTGRAHHLRSSHALSREVRAAIDAGILQGTDGGRSTPFVHDVFAEYCLALTTIDQIASDPHPSNGLHRLGTMAAAAEGSGIAQGVLELTILGLAASSQDAWRNLLGTLEGPLLPSATRGLATIVELHRQRGSLLHPKDVELLMALSGSLPEAELATALLQCPDVLTEAAPLVAARWMLDLLRAHGSTLWWRIVELLRSPAASNSLRGALFSVARVDDPDEARLLGHILPARIGGDTPLPESVAALAGHPAWQVRAAVASTLAELGSRSRQATEMLAGYLHEAEDYKVRAAVARSSQRIAQHNPQLMARLLRDSNWHVRSVVLERGRDLPLDVRESLIRNLSYNEWACAPLEARSRAWEMLFLTCGTDTLPWPFPGDRAADRALFRLLREAATGSRRHGHDLSRQLTEWAEATASPAVVREIERCAGGEGEDGDGSVDLTLLRAEFRRRRRQRRLQVALDCADLDLALRVAEAAAAAGVDLIEVGDPLIKQCGASAISAVKSAAPSTQVVAEMMSADWGRDQVEVAAFHGADAVLLIGLASPASIDQAINMARRLGVIVLLDVIGHTLSEGWCAQIQASGIDGFVVTTNIDFGMHAPYPLQVASRLRRWTDLPLAVSGGFGEADVPSIAAADCDIIVVGRSVVDAVDHAAVLRRLCAAVRNIGESGTG